MDSPPQIIVPFLVDDTMGRTIPRYSSSNPATPLPGPTCPCLPADHFYSCWSSVFISVEVLTIYAVADWDENPHEAAASDPQQSDSFPITERRRKSEIIRDRKAEKSIIKPEPPNLEIGWKRTKEIKLEKPKGYIIMDFLEKLETLMGMQYGSKELLAKTGEIVAEKAREEAEVLKEGGEVEERLVTELFRVLRLMEMDLAMVKAAVKEETLNERIEQAKARCRQAILVANSF
ncbi:potassium/sodium hyperpolarization-activated cyclic nucleotide-gated channel protein [Thalictrum thalictroides]|uniref:Potassium/sodium hyperpolarization-activated cyclic nucleotide-gated channel protein n=1 Tax=Thalictrum thalictroides TaxID=46969 RepID=A0A7J6XBH3_THATH|nr:potassium/sodium hyperpolarization-activated cyclic nucleotide-gated channel protein [Thalictrum thalictroides]